MYGSYELDSNLIKFDKKYSIFYNIEKSLLNLKFTLIYVNYQIETLAIIIILL